MMMALVLIIIIITADHVTANAELLRRPKGVNRVDCADDVQAVDEDRIFLATTASAGRRAGARLRHHRKRPHFTAGPLLLRWWLRTGGEPRAERSSVGARARSLGHQRAHQHLLLEDNLHDGLGEDGHAKGLAGVELRHGHRLTAQSSNSFFFRSFSSSSSLLKAELLKGGNVPGAVQRVDAQVANLRIVRVGVCGGGGGVSGR